MKIMVIGGSGRIGKLVVTQLRQQGHTVVAAARHAQDGPDTAFFDLHESPREMAVRLAGQDAVYFVAGSRGKDLLQTDLNGAVNVMRASEMAGVHRFIQLSSAFALQPERWSEDYLANLTDYNIAKYFADDWLIHRTQLDYTILQPGVLTETPATGKVTFKVTAPGENALADVATVLVGLISRPATIGKVIMMGSGDVPIAQALAAVK